jgi:hypothetical protein
MKRKMVTRFIVSTAVVIAWCFVHQAAAQPPRLFFIELRRMPQNDGSVHLQMDVSHGLQEVVHLPDGTTFSGGFDPNIFFADRTFTSFGELKQAIISMWTIECPAFPPLGIPHEEYTFSLSDFPESVISETSPAITYPLDGSTVPPAFTMTWAWPPGVTPSSGRSTLIRAQADSREVNYQRRFRRSTEGAQ